MKTEDGRADLKQRARDFAPLVVRLYAALPESIMAQTLGRQVPRSGTSVGADYREAVRSRSDAECVSKVEGAPQELEETAYWLELLAESDACKATAASRLRQEADELAAILVTRARKAKARKTAKEHARRKWRHVSAALSSSSAPHSSVPLPSSLFSLPSSILRLGPRCRVF